MFSARFCRARGYETLAICATDEHGAAIELAAQEEGISAAAYSAKWHQAQKDLGEKFGLSFDNFGRSSSPQNRELTLHFARALWKNGFLDVRTTKQLFRHRWPFPARPLCDRHLSHCNL